MASGTGLALAGARVAANLLLDVPWWDPEVYAVVVPLLALASLSAVLIPAIRASRASPIDALR